MWDVSDLGHSKAALGCLARSLEAKGFLDHPVAAIKFSPFEALTLVSCGSRGVRTHRVRHGSIRHCSIRLEDGLEEDPGALAVLRGNEFTDLDFDVNLTSLKTDAKYAYVAAARRAARARMRGPPSAQNGSPRV